jgi:DNA-binding transcriptional LysR family regulator
MPMPERTSPFLVEPEQLRTLLTLVERTTFSAAAAALGVQQSAVSHQVRRLEERLGRQLFRRTATGVEPTADGEALIIYARAMFKLDANVRSRFTQAGSTVTLRIGIIEDFNRTALPTVLWLFSREHPAFEFRIVSERAGSLMQMVREGKLDAAIVRHHDNPVGAELLFTDRLVWVGRRDFPVPVADPVPLVLPPPSGLRSAILETLTAAGRTWRVPFEGMSLAALEAALRAGLGVCAFAASMELFGVDVLDGAAGLPALPETRYMLLQGAAPASEAVAAFCQVLKNAARLSVRTDQDFPA